MPMIYPAGSPAAVGLVRAYIEQKQRRRQARAYDRVMRELAPATRGQRRRAQVYARAMMGSSYGKVEA